MTGNVIRKRASWIPPRKGKIIVDVVCTKAGERLAVVRIVPRLGPVLWYRAQWASARSRGPDMAILLRDLNEADEDFALWCPVCGSTPVDLLALSSLSKRATSSPVRLKFVA